jgi:hypothetical protein
LFCTVPQPVAGTLQRKLPVGGRDLGRVRVVGERGGRVRRRGETGRIDPVVAKALRNVGQLAFRGVEERLCRDRIGHRAGSPELT